MTDFSLDLHSIPVPEGARPDGVRIYVNTDIGKGTKKYYIGKYADKDMHTMYPNKNFYTIFPDLWEAHYGKRAPAVSPLKYGFYTLALAAGYQTELYPMLYDLFGPVRANAVMDFAMYSILFESNVAMRFPSSMQDRFLFSNKRYGDTWWSKFFQTAFKEIERERFLISWVRRCLKRGHNKIWLIVGESSYECSLQGPFSCEAVSATDGAPVASFPISEDSRSLQSILSELRSCGVQVVGIVLNHTFLNKETFLQLEDMHLDYVIHAKQDTYGFQVMAAEQGKNIYMNPNYQIDTGPLFGTVSAEPIPIFKLNDHKDYVCLYYDGSHEDAHDIERINQVFRALSKAREQARRGRKPRIPADMQSSLQVTERIQDGAKPTYEVVAEGAISQNTPAEKGFSALITHEPKTAAEAERIYAFLRTFTERDSGDRVLRAHSEDGVQNRQLVAFASRVIYHEIQRAYAGNGNNFARFVQNIDNMLYAKRDMRGQYTPVNRLTREGRETLYDLGITLEDVGVLCDEISRRVHASGPVSLLHDMPDGIREHNALRLAHAKQKNKAAPDATSQSAQNTPAPKPEEPKRGVGRPRGSKDTHPRKRRGANQ